MADQFKSVRTSLRKKAHEKVADYERNFPDGPIAEPIICKECGGSAEEPRKGWMEADLLATCTADIHKPAGREKPRYSDPRREAIEKALAAIGQIVLKELPKDRGFIFRADKVRTQIESACRAHAAKVLREMADEYNKMRPTFENLSTWATVNELRARAAEEEGGQ